MKKPVPVESASAFIDERIKELGDWRGKTLAKVREIIHEADPEIVEEWKWMGTPVWSHGGIVCTGETYKNVVKMTFAKGAALKDPSGLFNSSLDGNVRRAIDIHEGDKVDEAALKDLIRAAVALNLKGKSKPKPRRASSKRAELASSQVPAAARSSDYWPIRARWRARESDSGLRRRPQLDDDLIPGAPTDPVLSSRSCPASCDRMTQSRRRSGKRRFF